MQAHTRKLPELLAPAGSPEALRAAVAAGADAVYLGGSFFNARANAVNFDDTAIADAIAYCRLCGVKSYVTLNTLLFDRELAAFREYAAFLYRAGVSAVIVADRGAIEALHRDIPDLEIHASTQASVHSTDGAIALHEAGAKRVVLARELSLADIRTVTETAGVETEIFLHGALCVSHSGQCLFSSLVGGRSGNRGECAQPCRLPYNGGYPISLRDLSLADHIPALIESGVSSLKIEGRMKSAAYVHGVTAIYRRLLDEGRAATAEENRHLRELFSRSGFTDSYLRGRPGEPMTGVRSEQDKSDSRAVSIAPIGDWRLPARGHAVIRAGEPARFTLTLSDGRAVSTTGDVPAPARSAPLTKEAVADRLSRMGGTPIALLPTDVTVELDEGLNLSPGAINALRRAAVARLTEPPKEATSFSLPPYRLPEKTDVGAGRTALFFDPTVAKALGEDITFFDTVFFPLDKWDAVAPRPHGVYLPPVVTDSEREGVLTRMRKARAAGVELALVGNVGMLRTAREMGFCMIGDFRLNVTNRESAAAYRAAGVEEIILSPELTLPQMRDIGGAAIVYGHIPLMLTERCFIKENFRCDACGKTGLTDRRGMTFPLLREYPHRNLILNSLPTYMGDKQTLLRQYGIGGQHFIFTVESAKEAAAVLRAWRAGQALPCDVRRIAR